MPTENEEAVRDLLRARGDLREDILRARHRLSKFLLRHGRTFGEGSQWTARHRGWVDRQVFEQPAATRTLAHYRVDLDTRLAELALLDAELLEIARAEPYQSSVARLATLRGISTLS